MAILLIQERVYIMCRGHIFGVWYSERRYAVIKRLTSVCRGDLSECDL